MKRKISVRIISFVVMLSTSVLFAQGKILFSSENLKDGKGFERKKLGNTMVMDFKVENSGITLPSSQAFSGGFTMALWVCPGTIPQGRYVHLLNRRGYDIELNFTKANKYEFRLWNAAKNNIHQIESGSLLPTDWHFVAATYSKKTGMMTLYVDYKKVAEKHLTEDIIRLGSEFYVGRRQKCRPGTRFTGQIGKFFIADSAYTPEELKNIFQKEKGAYPNPVIKPKSSVPLPAYADTALTPERKALLLKMIPGQLEEYKNKINDYKAMFQKLFAGHEKMLQCQRVGKRMEIISRLLEFIKQNHGKKTVSGLLFAENGVDDLRVFCEYFDQEIMYWKRFPVGAVTPVIFNLRDFGAVGDGKTSDTNAFYKAFDAVRKLKGKPSILKIPAGTYLLTQKKVMPPFTSIHTGEKVDDKNLQHAQLAIYELKNCLIEGENGEKTKILFGCYDSQGIRLINCENTTISNLHLSWQMIPFFQGTVLAVDGTKGTAVVQHDPGTLRPDAPCYRNHKQMLVCPMFSPQGKIYTPASFMFFARKANDLGGGKFRVYMDTGKPYYTHAKMKVGYKIIIPDRNNFYHAASMCYTVFCNMENITIRTSRAGAFSTHRGYMSSFSNCRIYPLPGMVFSTNADGLINSPGTYMSNCEFRNMSDDGFNSHIRGVHISKTDGGSKIIHKDVGRRLPGDRMLLVNPVTGQYYSNLHVKDGSRLSKWRGASLPLTEFEEKLPEKLKTFDNLSLNTYTQEQRNLITHNLIKLKSEPDQLYAPNGDGIGSVITGCKFYSVRNNGIVIQGANTLIENTTIEAINWIGIRLGAFTKYQEGPPPYNVIIRNNKIDDTSFGLVCQFQIQNNVPAETAPTLGVLFENNEIKNSSIKMMDIFNMGDSVIRNNRFYGKKTVMQFTLCEDLLLEGNTVNDKVLTASDVFQKQCCRIIVK